MCFFFGPPSWSVVSLKISSHLNEQTNERTEMRRKKNWLKKKSVINICICFVRLHALTFCLACLINHGGLVKNGIRWNSTIVTHTASNPTQNDNKFAKQFNSHFLHGSCFFFSIFLYFSIFHSFVALLVRYFFSVVVQPNLSKCVCVGLCALYRFLFVCACSRREIE